MDNTIIRVLSEGHDNVLMKRLGKWKYSPDELTQQVPDVLFKVVKPKWDSAMKVSKDINEQTLRKIMPSHSEKEVKESF